MTPLGNVSQPPDVVNNAEFMRWLVLFWKKFTNSKAPTITITSNRIAPTTPVSFVGAGLIKNITPLENGTITLIPTAAFTTDATGNIAVASTAVVNRAMTMTYDTGTAKWYPGYI